MRVLIADFNSIFDELLVKSDEITIRCSKLQKLMIEIYKCICEDTAKAPEWEKKTEQATNREEGIVDFHGCCERSCF